MWKIILCACGLTVMLTGCNQSRYVNLPGYAHATDPDCRRTQPPSKYDRKCDCPATGFSNFTPPDCPVSGI